MAGTAKHSRASKKRWRAIPKPLRSQRMGSVSQAGWDALTPKQRRKRALKGVATRTAKKLLEGQNKFES